MKLSEIETEKLKTVELALLKEFINVCETLNLTYYVIGGTLLGTVRHKGFIPWDDDIDVAMKRADYEIFISEAQKYLPEYYFVQSLKSEPDLPYNFCKLRDSRTTFIESSIRKFKINHGIYIDIFPLDFYPDDEKQASVFDRDNYKLTQSIIKNYTAPHLTRCERLKNNIRKILFVFNSYKKQIIKREELYKSISDSSLVANLCGAWGRKEIVPKKWFNEVVELEFEGIKVNAPKDYDLWLKQVYGNYMELPPVEKRVAHHYVDVVDFDKSYKFYVK